MHRPLTTLATLAQHCTRLAQHATPPRQAKKVIDEELLKLQSLEPTNPWFNVTRSYLEWLTVPPRNAYSKA